MRHGKEVPIKLAFVLQVKYHTMSNYGGEIEYCHPPKSVTELLNFLVTNNEQHYKQLHGGIESILSSTTKYLTT